MFDVVFCQNVLIYFDRATRLAIINALFARTRMGGLLVLGAGEDIGWQSKGAERVSAHGVTAFKKLEV
jgi:chemotaxis methyl-accepting protein methylase